MNQVSGRYRRRSMNHVLIRISLRPYQLQCAKRRVDWFVVACSRLHIAWSAFQWPTVSSISMTKIKELSSKLLSTSTTQCGQSSICVKLKWSLNTFFAGNNSCYFLKNACSQQLVWFLISSQQERNQYSFFSSRYRRSTDSKTKASIGREKKFSRANKLFHFVASQRLRRAWRRPNASLETLQRVFNWRRNDCIENRGRNKRRSLA